MLRTPQLAGQQEGARHVKHGVVRARDGEVAIAVLEQPLGGREATFRLGDQFTDLALAHTAIPSARTFSNSEKLPRSVMMLRSTNRRQTMMPDAIETSVAIRRRRCLSANERRSMSSSTSTSMSESGSASPRARDPNSVIR